MACSATRPSETEQPLDIAVGKSLGRDHLRVQQRTRRQQPVQVAAVTVGVVHHRRDGHPPVEQIGTFWISPGRIRHVRAIARCEIQ